MADSIGHLYCRLHEVKVSVCLAAYVKTKLPFFITVTFKT